MNEWMKGILLKQNLPIKIWSSLSFLIHSIPHGFFAPFKLPKKKKWKTENVIKSRREMHTCLDITKRKSIQGNSHDGKQKKKTPPTIRITTTITIDLKR